MNKKICLWLFLYVSTACAIPQTDGGPQPGASPFSPSVSSPLPSLSPPPTSNTTLVVEELVDITWRWDRLELADSTIFSPYLSATFAPTLRFHTSETTNKGEAGLQFGGNFGCNGMGGLYFANAQRELLITQIMSTSMACGGHREASETLGLRLLRLVERYEIVGNELYLFTPAGDRFVLINYGELPADSKIYADIVNSQGIGESPFLIVAEPMTHRVDFSVAQAREQIQFIFPERSFGDVAVSAALLDEFFSVQGSGIHQIEFTSGEPAFIGRAEVDMLFATGSKEGWEAVEERFPGVTTIFAFSKVGFVGDRGLVYYEILSSWGGHSGYYSLRYGANGNWQGGSSHVVR